MRLPFVDRFRRLAANASGLVGTRLSLFSLELQEELERQLGHLALLLGLFAFGSLGFVFAAVLILTFAWEHGHLLAAVAGITLVCVVGAAACAVLLIKRVRSAPQPFNETLAEFKRDEQALRGTPASPPSPPSATTPTPGART
ncbi:phage holin family protein [Uliginosibacterium sp. H3]|uniref:Phage holin family protein n=1 Tax=Uliginosibacterium silvisoli TaxID=3114758 RepID=A0ABU6JYW6_9RHOO|nr:phage holin family protein [Uliginosibacterium sp. H3]